MAAIKSTKMDLNGCPSLEKLKLCDADGGESTGDIKKGDQAGAGMLEIGIMEPCKLKELIPAKPLTSDEQGYRFRIVHYSHANFPEFQVMTGEVFQNEFFWLMEDILDVVESDAKLSEEPSLYDVVLAPTSGQNFQYHRAVVVSKSIDDRKIGVYFFDVGGYETLDAVRLKPVTKEVMKFPVLGYPVILQGFSSADFDSSFDKETILILEFEEMMLKLSSAATHYRLQKVGQVRWERGDNSNDMDEKFTKHEVSLHFDPEQREMDRKPSKRCSNLRGERSLSGEIKELGRWQWEALIQKHPKTHWTDDKIFANNKIEPLIDWEVYCPPVGSQFTAQVARILAIAKTTGGSDETRLKIILLDDPFYANSHRVLNLQMERYCKTVEKSMHFPAIKERCLIKIDEKEEYVELGLRNLGKWCRAVRLDSDWMYLYDWDNHISLDRLDDADFEVRRLPLEFNSIASAVLDLCPMENGLPMTFKKATEAFQDRGRYGFKILRVRENHVLDAEYITIQKN